MGPWISGQESSMGSAAPVKPFQTEEPLKKTMVPVSSSVTASKPSSSAQRCVTSGGEQWRWQSVTHTYTHALQ